jgi:hypothetical protein
MAYPSSEKRKLFHARTSSSRVLILLVCVIAGLHIVKCNVKPLKDPLTSFIDKNYKTVHSSGWNISLYVFSIVF